MEDTQKLTRLTALEADEAQLLEDFFANRAWDSGKQLRFNAMREGLFLAPHLSGFESDRVKGDIRRAA